MTPFAPSHSWWRFKASKLAEAIASEFGGRAQNLPLVARSLGLHVSLSTHAIPDHDALFWHPDDPALGQMPLFGQANAHLFGSPHARSRFTLAHEIGHRVAQLHLTQEERQQLKPAIEEVFANEFASRLLVSDTALNALAATACEFRFEVTELETWSRSLQVSISCLIKRINDGTRDGFWNLRSGAILARDGLSRKHHLNYALRVGVSCLPADWYIPTNTRLTSLGMTGIPVMATQATPFSTMALYDHLKVKTRPDWEEADFLLLLRWKVYRAVAASLNTVLITFAIDSQSDSDLECVQ